VIDFELTEKQKMIKKTAHDFAAKEIRPLAAEIDLDPDPDGALRAIDNYMKQLELGFHLIGVPEEYGGQGGTNVDLAILTEELCWGDRNIGIATSINTAFGNDVINVGTKRQKEKWLPHIIGEEAGILAGCFTEPTGGSEVFCPLPDPALGVKTTAVRDGDYYVINGAKCFSSWVKVAKIAFVLTRTDKTKSNREGTSIFIVPTDTPGFHVGRAENKIGCRTMHNSEVNFENMRVPAENLLGEKEGTMPMATVGGALFGAQVVGMARAAYETVLAYARERVIWGKPLTEYENVATKLVDMYSKIIAMRAMVWQICWAGDNPEKAQGLEKLDRMGKVYPTSMIRGITADAVQIMGGFGCMKPNLVEKLARDAMLLPIIGTPNEVLTYFLGKTLLTT
jgi:acyl-CoA dehydrogenase